jgi:FimV-like protein
VKRSFLAVSALATVLAGGAVIAAPQNQDSELANVQAIMQRAHQQQDQKRQTQQLQQQNQKAAEKAGASFMQSIIKNSKNNSKQQFVTQGSSSNVQAPVAPATTAPLTSQSSVMPTSGNPQVQELETQLSQLNQANTTFQRQTDQRIDVLNQEHNVLQGKLSALGQVLGILNQEVTQLNQQITSAQKQLSTNLTPQQQQSMQATTTDGFVKSLEGSKTTQYILYAILILLIIIIMMLIPRRGGYKIQAVAEGAAGGANAANESTEDTKDEYDFMNSDEAIPAKLDLARAYMAMEDYTSARKVLDQVQRTGNDEQKSEAEKMFEKIPKE